MTDEDQIELLIDCPECNQSIHVDTEMCPACGYFLCEQDRRQARGAFQSYRGCFRVIAMMLILGFAIPFISRIIEILWDAISAQVGGS